MQLHSPRTCSDCLSPELVCAYVHHLVSWEQAEAIESHLRVCSHCKRRCGSSCGSGRHQSESSHRKGSKLRAKPGVRAASGRSPFSVSPPGLPSLSLSLSSPSLSARLYSLQPFSLLRRFPGSPIRRFTSSPVAPPSNREKVHNCSLLCHTAPPNTVRPWEKVHNCSTICYAFLSRTYTLPRKEGATRHGIGETETRGIGDLTTNHPQRTAKS
jgi:hypothetical protein